MEAAVLAEANVMLQHLPVPPSGIASMSCVPPGRMRVSPEDGSLIGLCVGLQGPLLKAGEQGHELRLPLGQAAAAAAVRAEADVVLQHLQDGLALYDAQHMELMAGDPCLLHFLSDWKGLHQTTCSIMCYMSPAK